MGVAAAIALSTLGVAPTASADPESEAKDLFARARDMRTKGDCAGAVPLFQKAYKVYPNAIGSLRNIAECEETLGHYASARRAWLDIKRALVTLAQDPKYDGWDKDAQDAAARLQPKVATVVVDVIVKSPQGEAPANEKTGVEVFVNGENLGTTLVGTPLERDPGNYKVRVQAQYAQPAEQDVTLTAGDTKHVTLNLVQTPPSKGPEEIDTGKGKRTAGIVMMGVGGAALVGSLVTFLIRNGKKSDLEAACPNYETQPCKESSRSAAQDAVDGGKTMSTLTTVFLVAGGVSLGAGVGLYLWGASSKEPGTPPTGSLALTPGVGRIAATWRF
jgi:hypothetical protein